MAEDNLDACNADLQTIYDYNPCMAGTIETVIQCFEDLNSIILGESDVEICHNPGKNNQSTMLVNIQALQGHLNHNDN